MRKWIFLLLALTIMAFVLMPVAVMADMAPRAGPGSDYAITANIEHSDLSIAEVSIAPTMPGAVSTIERMQKAIAMPTADLGAGMEVWGSGAPETNNAQRNPMTPAEGSIESEKSEAIVTEENLRTAISLNATEVRADVALSSDLLGKIVGAVNHKDLVAASAMARVDNRLPTDRAAFHLKFPMTSLSTMACANIAVVLTSPGHLRV